MFLRIFFPNIRIQKANVNRFPTTWRVAMSSEFAFEWLGSDDEPRELHFSMSLDELYDDDFTIDSTLAMLQQSYNVPPHYRDDLSRQFHSFVQRVHADAAAEQNDFVMNFSSMPEDDVEVLAQKCMNVTPSDAQANVSVFVDTFRALLQSPFPDIIQMLMRKQSDMVQEVHKLLRERDFDLERLKREHAQLMAQVTHDLNDVEGANERQLSTMASRHFEKMHSTEANYASQLVALSEAQRREFRSFVNELHTQQMARESGIERAAAAATLRPATLSPPISPAKRGTSPSQRSDGALSPNHLDESFTIYLGAQLKTMHNLRLSALNPLDLCRRDDESERLHMALSLYGDRLSGVLLLGDARPMNHVNLHSDFARACEKSTELHFESLDVQLENIENECVNVNTWRTSVACRGAVTESSSSSSLSNKRFAGDSLRPGDVYVTRHSNLARVSVVFHMVNDDALATEDINSRHGCINGVRNVIRLCAKFNVTTIALPLLLVDKITEDMTVAWCLRRAELVFKCVKGFLMEIAALGSGQDGGKHPQYTVQFMLPPEISLETFRQIADMLSTIFHFVNAVVA